MNHDRSFSLALLPLVVFCACSGSVSPAPGGGGNAGAQTTGGNANAGGAKASGGGSAATAGRGGLGGNSMSGSSAASCPNLPPASNDLCDISQNGTSCNYTNQCFICQCISNQPGVTCRYSSTACPTQQCIAVQGSCAQGEACCAGLTCCSGVPVPAGSEYCGTTCPRSDQALKRGFASVNEADVLERLVKLPISTWSYKTEGTQVQHLGPMAQDFKAAFGLGESDRTILQVDADGVAFAAIHALYARLVELESSNRALTQRLRELEMETQQCRVSERSGSRAK
jgi:hypothetical protein